jgi:hypothetical protein
MEKAYPQKFKDFFFRIVKTLVDSKKMKSYKNSDIKGRYRKKPTSFMVVGKTHTYNSKVKLCQVLKNLK